MTIQITIQKNSEAATAYKKYMADKEACLKAIKNGKVIKNCSDVFSTTSNFYKLAEPIKL